MYLGSRAGEAAGKGTDPTEREVADGQNSGKSTPTSLSPFRTCAYKTSLSSLGKSVRERGEG